MAEAPEARTSPVEQETVSNNSQSNLHITTEQPASTVPRDNHEPSTLEENRLDDNSQILHTENISSDIVTNDNT